MPRRALLVLLFVIALVLAWLRRRMRRQQLRLVLSEVSHNDRLAESSELLAMPPIAPNPHTERGRSHTPMSAMDPTS